MEKKEKEGSLNMPQEGTVVAVVQTETEQKKEIVKKLILNENFQKIFDFQ